MDNKYHSLFNSGEVYACCRKSEWCRIVIEETKSDGKILVACVDNDTYFATLRKDLRILPPKYAHQNKPVKSNSKN